MSQKTYHHGDLRLALIEKGIELIYQGGIQALSLRKAAAACGVSHAAPYAHFKSKDALLEAIGSHIAAKFANALKMVAGEPSIEGLVNIGWAYVLFFSQHPHYYDFIFIRGNVKVGEKPYEPYDFFRQYMISVFEKIRYPKEKWQTAIIAQWALFHGLASLAVIEKDSNHVTWESRVREILTKKYIITIEGY